MNRRFGLREALADIAAEHVEPGDTVAVLLSGGADSLSVAFSIEDAGGRVLPFTFRVEGREDSEDLRAARMASDALGWDLVEVDVPADLETIRRDFVSLVRDFGCRKKTQVECAWPFLYVAPAISDFGITTTFDGFGADGHYGLSKKAMIHHRYPKAEFDAFRADYFGASSPAASREIRRIFEAAGQRLVSPYLYRRIYARLVQFDWDELNKPRQKMPVVEEYADYFARLGGPPRRHANLQLVAEIPALFERLLDTDLNENGRTRVMDLVRDYAKAVA